MLDLEDHSTDTRVVRKLRDIAYPSKSHGATGEGLVLLDGGDGTAHEPDGELLLVCHGLRLPSVEHLGNAQATTLGSLLGAREGLQAHGGSLNDVEGVVGAERLGSSLPFLSAHTVNLKIKLAIIKKHTKYLRINFLL